MLLLLISVGQCMCYVVTALFEFPHYWQSVVKLWSW